MPNHFKSKRGGDDADAVARRRLQADTAASIVRSAAKNISPYVVLAGDLNDTPDSPPLAALFEDGWKDVQSHPDYPTDRPGTYDTAWPTTRSNYLIMPPALFSCVQTTGIERRGSYHPGTWKPFDTVTSKRDEASDHHLLWADLEIPD